MFNALRNALRPTFANMLTGATYAAGGAIGIALIKGAGNLLTKGADTVTKKVEDRKLKNKVERNVSVEVQPAA